MFHRKLYDRYRCLDYLPSSPAVCAICSDGYTRGFGYLCSECNEGRRNSTVAAAIALLLVAASMVALSVIYLGSYARTQATKFMRARLWFERVSTSQGFKVIIVSWQIVAKVCKREADDSVHARALVPTCANPCRLTRYNSNVPTLLLFFKLL